MIDIKRCNNCNGEAENSKVSCKTCKHTRDSTWDAYVSVMCQRRQIDVFLDMRCPLWEGRNEENTKSVRSGH